MTAENFIAAKASEAVKAIYGADIEASSLQVQPTRKEFEGDYTLVVFPLLRTTRQSPDATGDAIGRWLVGNCREICAYNSVKGFLNLSLSNDYWKEALEQAASDPSFGQLPPTGKRIMVEFSSPNTNKPLHLGHVRNNLLGFSVSELLKAAGNEVIRATLVNDRGVHICKSMYAWQQRFDGATPESTGKKGDHLVGDCYVEYARMEKEDPTVIDKVHEMLVKWEEGDPEVRALWQMMNGWVFDGFEQTYKALGITFDKTYYEHDTYLLGKELVQKGLDMGVFTRDPDGSVWCDLTADGLDRKLLLRSDGTSVYITQDLGTAEKRFSEYRLDSHIYVVGDEQNYHFQVLKLILSKLGFAWADLIEKMYQEAKATSEESGKLDNVSDEEKDRLYSMIGLGALKYFILKVDPKKKMLFNPKESIDFNGNTGPFIQYTHARIQSILRKAAEQGFAASAAPGVQLSPKETRLVKLISSYPQKVGEAAASLSPALIANYCYELAKEFNQYYHDTSILHEPDAGLLSMRLELISTLASVLRRAMKILGIELPDRM